MDNDLAHKNKIANIVGKCNNVSGMFRRSLGYNAPTSVFLNLYKTLVSRFAVYYSPVWSPQGKMHLQASERIQRDFTKFALHYPNFSYKERCSLLD